MAIKDHLECGILAKGNVSGCSIALGEAFDSATVGLKRGESRHRRWWVMGGFCLELLRVGELLVQS